MIIELLVNLRISSGNVLLAGRYDNSRREFPEALWREIEIHKKTGRRTLRILQEDSPIRNQKSKNEKAISKDSVDTKATTIDDENTFTTTTTSKKSKTSDEKPKKKTRRSKSS